MKQKIRPKKIRRSLAAMLIAVLVMAEGILPAAAQTLTGAETDWQFVPTAQITLPETEGVTTASEAGKTGENPEAAEDTAAAEALPEETAQSTEFVGGYLSSDYAAPLISQTPRFASAGAGLQSALQTGQAIPAAYESSYVTPINNQGSDGTCWAFAYTQAAETDRIVDGASDTLRYGTLGTAFYFYHLPKATDPLGLVSDKVKNDNLTAYSYLVLGGNITLTARTLSAWTGVFDETTVPYTNAEKTKLVNDQVKFADLDLAAVQTGAYYYNVTDRDEIKRAIIEHGSIQVAYCASYTVELNETDPKTGKKKTQTVYTGALDYCDGESGEQDYYVYQSYNKVYSGGVKVRPANHAVQIIGWDDSIQPERFTKGGDGTPTGTGAWLVRNSWGSGWPKNKGTSGTVIDHPGCFWLSYEDYSIDPTMVAVDMEPASEYLNNYHYDASASSGVLTAYGEAVVFRAQHTELITAINVGIHDTNIDYTASVYLFGKEDDDKPLTPKGTTAKATKTGSTSAEGFYTLKLDKPVRVEKDQWFSVVVEPTTKRNVTFLADVTQEGQFGGALSFIADAKEGRGYGKNSVGAYSDVGFHSNKVPRL